MDRMHAHIGGGAAVARLCCGILAGLLAILLIQSCAGVEAEQPAYDLIVRQGMIYDGSGSEPFQGDIAVRGDRIVFVGEHAEGRAHRIIDARGKAVAPGFINMLSWSTETLLADGRAESELRQGVTLQVMGEGYSMGPLTDPMKAELVALQQESARYPVTWTTLGEYLDQLAARGISPNIASFVGAGTVREFVLGNDDVDPTPEQLDAMRGVVRRAMEEGALGVASSLIYAPGMFAKTPELIALAAEAGRCGGIYATHMRSEGDHFLEALDETIAIARATGTPTEIYHLKVGGRENWPKMALAVERIEAARRDGVPITADIYPYTASGTGLDATMPPWVRAGGIDDWIERLQDPQIRQRVVTEMQAPTSEWENVLRMSGPAGATVVGVRDPELESLIGKTLAEIAATRGLSPEEAAIELVIADRSPLSMVYHTMSEDNLRRLIALPYVSFASDGAAMSAEGAFLKSRPHPRAYGSFARILGHYVRDAGIVSLKDAIHRMTGHPAELLGLEDRGLLRPGYYADIVIFDPETIDDRATYVDPHRYAVGVSHVFVNGVEALRDGEPTGAASGRVVRGRGWTGGAEPGACGAAGAERPH